MSIIQYTIHVVLVRYLHIYFMYGKTSEQINIIYFCVAVSIYLLYVWKNIWTNKYVNSFVFPALFIILWEKFMRKRV